MAVDKDGWEEGTVYARHVGTDGSIHYQEHRSWNMTEFCKKQAAACASANAEVEKRTHGKEKGEARFERITKDEYDKAMKLQRRHGK